MLKRLPLTDNAAGLHLDQPCTEPLGITRGVELDTSTDQKGFSDTRSRPDADRKSRLALAQARALANHSNTFKRLAQ